MNKKSLKNRYKKSYDTKDGESRQRALDFAGKEISFYKPKSGSNKIIIIPYIIRTEKHPLVMKNEMEIGDLDYVLDLFIHKNIGVSKIDIVCPAKNYGKRCPICEESQNMKSQGDDAGYKELAAKRRVFYNVIDKVEDDGEIKIFESSHFLFEKELIEEARTCENGDDIVSFAGPDEDEFKIIKFRGAEKKFGKREFIEFKSFKFLDCDEEIDDETIKSAINLDKYIISMTAQEIEDILYGNDSENDEEKKSDCEDDETDEEEEKNKKTSKKRDNKKNKKSNNKCEFGHKFGIDNDTHEDCDECNLWDECLTAKETKKKGSDDESEE